MLANFFSKPLQGKKFRMYRLVIMGWDNVSTLWKYLLDNNSPGNIVPSKKCVEENVKTVILEEPLRGAKKVEGIIRNTDHTTTVLWSDIVKNGVPEPIEYEMRSKGKSS